MSKKFEYKVNGKTLGVLGGIGPEASVCIYQRIVKIAQDVYGAQQDSDYPPILIYNLPLKGFDETGFVDKDLVKKQLIEGLKKLENAGSDFIVIACNTVYYFYEDMQNSINVPIVNLIEKTIDQVLNEGFKKVAILNSESTKNLKLYENMAISKGIEPVLSTDKEQEIINNIILTVMSGSNGEKEVILLKKIIDRMVSEGAEAVVLGCTELPIAIKKEDISPLSLFDTISIAGEEVLIKAYLK